MSKSYKCPECGLVYSEEEVLVDAYTDSNHEQTVTFSCPNCGEPRPDEANENQ